MRNRISILLRNTKWCHNVCKFALSVDAVAIFADYAATALRVQKQRMMRGHIRSSWRCLVFLSYDHQIQRKNTRDRHD